MRRRVEPELLDELSPLDPRAARSRLDLLRLNRLMGHSGIVARALELTSAAPDRMVELGAGDGRFALEVARVLAPRWRNAHLVLVDRVNIVTDETIQSFRTLDWTVEVIRADVFDWLEKSARAAGSIMCNLFLHHFGERELARLLALVSVRADRFVACEPRRSYPVLASSRLLGLIGCNAVTRHDAVTSVRAGFNQNELSMLWPAGPAWLLRERAAGLFSHCFVANRSILLS